MKRVRRALIAVAAICLPFVGLGGGAAIVAPTAAHAGPPPPAFTEQYSDVTAYNNCWDSCAAADYMQTAGNHLVDVVGSTGGNLPTSWTVFFNGNGYWCFTDLTNEWMGIGGTNQLIDNYGSSCNVGGDEWVIHCTSTAHEFKLQNVHNSDYVDYNTAGVYHADGLIGDTFYDLSLSEC